MIRGWRPTKHNAGKNLQEKAIFSKKPPALLIFSQLIHDLFQYLRSDYQVSSGLDSTEDDV